uniref:Uncharacterized protein n=1 Tax=Mimivirus LCMiAC02 TaxID=2506609 RepID=A0A4P6VP57_9VIRU|nr:MAG: hypothetical protein LCMiAC02_04640 [Mimivirus LCMiAC02]
MSNSREIRVSQVKKLQKRVRKIYNKMQSLEKEKIEINKKILNLCPHDEIIKEPGEYHGPSWNYVCNICCEYIKKHNIDFNKIKLIQV